MSKRPTATARRILSKTFDAPMHHGYAVMGDTTAAVMYAHRLLRNGITHPIHIITEGVDKTGIPQIESIDFGVNHVKRMLHHLITEQVHLIPYESGTYDPETHYTQEHQVFHYYAGSGPLGELISAYHIPRNGPWYPSGSTSRMERFMHDHSMRCNLNDVEMSIATALAKIWNIKLSASIVITEPTMLNCHYEFVQEHEDTYQRDIGLEVFHHVEGTSNVTLDTEAGVLQFTPGVTSGTYNITGEGIDLKEMKLAWKTNEYTYLRRATLGGLNPAPIQISAFYRAVLTIPLFNTVDGIDFSALEPGYDLLTTHLAFSLHDIDAPKQSAITWLAQCYTTIEDLSVVDQSGRYADTGHCLLIVEAICTKNKRKASYNCSEKEVQIFLNSPETEALYLQKFCKITGDIYMQYTGTHINPELLSTNISICGAGMCHDGNSITNYATRESPMVSLLALTSHLYASDK